MWATLLAGRRGYDTQVGDGCEATGPCRASGHALCGVGGAVRQACADVRTDAGAVAPSSAGQRSSYSVIGPWMDYYFNAHRGLHMPASVGLAVVRGLDAEGVRFNRDNTAFGAGFLIGVGYEWWVSDEWSVGVLGRLAGIVATNKDDDGRRWIHAIGSAPSVLFTATYN